MKKTRICELLGIEYPIIQAPMNWITGADLAAAVSNAGGLGTMGPNAGQKTVTSNPAETGERLRDQIRKVKRLTSKPFGVMFSARGPEFKTDMEFSEACLKVALQEGIPVAVLAGTHPERLAPRLKEAGVKIIHRPRPCSVEESKRVEALGVDIVVAAGYEAGGHGSALRIPTFVLVPQVVDAVKIPVLAGGGVADARGFVAALALGAEGVFIGTAFIATYECDAHPNLKQALVQAGDTDTVTWMSPHTSTRGLRNKLTDRILEMEAKGASLFDISALERSTNRRGELEGDVVNAYVGCGAGVGLIKEVVSAQQLVRSMIEGAERILSGLS